MNRRLLGYGLVWICRRTLSADGSTAYDEIDGTKSDSMKVSFIADIK